MFVVLMLTPGALSGTLMCDECDTVNGGSSEKNNKPIKMSFNAALLFTAVSFRLRVGVDAPAHSCN